jgi:AraC-like DNA-binding protein
MQITKSILTFLFLLLVSLTLAQVSPSKKLDSLQAAFLSLKNTDTTGVVKTGNAILKFGISDRQRFDVFQQIAQTYFTANNFNKSIDYSFKAKEVAEKSGDAQMMAQAYGSIANEYSYLELTEKSRLYLKLAIAQIEKLPDGDKKHNLKALSYLELGNLDFNEQDYKAANKNQQLALAQFRLIKGISGDKKNRYNYRRAFYNIGNSYYYLKAPDSAEAYLEKALAIDDPENPNLKYFIYSSLSEVYTLRGQYKRAIDTLQAILKDAEFDNKPLKAEVLLNLSRNYQKTGDKANYARYNEWHLALRDTVEGHTRSAIDTAFSVEQKDHSQSMLESQRRNTLLWCSIVALLAASLGAILYLQRRKKREHAIYLSIIGGLEKQVELSTKPEVKPETDTKTSHSISSSVEEEILKGLQHFENNQGFCNSKLTLSMLAVELRTNPVYLSTIIKAQKDQNFNTYINELRIRYICQKIHTQREYANYKISYLAEDCGFTSHSTFSTIFKKVTGISPSLFLSEEEKRHAAGIPA